MRKNNQSITYGVLNIVAAVATLCTASLFILNAIRSFKK